MECSCLSVIEEKQITFWHRPESDYIKHANEKLEFFFFWFGQEDLEKENRGKKKKNNWNLYNTKRISIWEYDPNLANRSVTIFPSHTDGSETTQRAVGAAGSLVGESTIINPHIYVIGFF